MELKVSESSISFDTGVSSKMITISSNYPWSISVPSNWLSLSLNRGEAGEYTISVTCTANNSTSDRSTELRLISEDSELSIKIFQDGRILRVQGMDNKLELDFMAQDFKIDVLSNSTYYHVITYPSVSFPSTTASWLSRVDTKSASVSTIVFHASRNNDAIQAYSIVHFKSS